MNITRLNEEIDRAVRKCVKFDHNGAKMHGNIEILLEHPSGKIGSFDGLTVLIVQFDKVREINLR